MDQIVKHSALSSDHSAQDLLDRAEACIEDGLIPVEIFGDQQIFDLEMTNIFARQWVFLGFESEIPTGGDFVLRRIGKDQVIVSRDRDGTIHVLANFCRHRGAQICSTDRGNALNFRCPYHGWVYKNNGEWRGAPDKSMSYPQLDTSEWGLLRAPHVDTMFGLIFACLDPEAPPLREALGPAAWMMQALMDLHPGGMSVMGPPDRYRVRGNWKTASENFAGDAYHISVAHRSVEKINLGQGFDAVNQFTINYALGDGHAFTGSATGDLLGEVGEYWGYSPEIRAQFDLSALDDLQKEVIRRHPPAVGNIFPNLSFVRFTNTPPEGEWPCVYTSWRQWQPISSTETEVLSWQLKWNFMSDEQAAKSYATGQYGFSSAGIFEQDDTVLWEGAPQVAQSTWARKAGATFNMQLGMAKLGGAQQRDPEWKGPGARYTPGPGEAPARDFYARWLRELKSGL